MGLVQAEEVNSDCGSNRRRLQVRVESYDSNAESLLEPGGRIIRVERTPFCSAFPGLVCCLVKSPTGPGQGVTSLTHPTGTLRGPGHLPPAGTTEWGLRPPSGPRSVSRSLRCTGVPSGSPGHGGLGRSRLGADDFGVYVHDVAAAVPWHLYGSDGHGATRVEDKADRARNGPLPESNSVCVICFGDP